MYNEDSDGLFAGARSRDVWIRGLLVLLFLAVLWFVRLIVLILAAFQFVFAIVTGGPNRRLLPFCGSLATYMRQIAGFVTWVNETRPYPFSNWPEDEEGVAGDWTTEARTGRWDDSSESDTANRARAPQPAASEPLTPEPVDDEPPLPPKPRSGGAKGKKKKQSPRRKPADTGSAGDEPDAG